LGNQTGAKRSLFAPIVLVLLTFSLIANVFLYSQWLQNKHEQRADKGQLLIKQAADTKLYFTTVQQHIEALLEGDADQTRIQAKMGLGLAARYSDSVIGLIQAADMRKSASPAPAKRDAAAFISEVNTSLGAVANHGGALTGTERDYLLLIRDSYRKLSESAARLNTEWDTKQAALQMEAGGDWVDIAHDLLKLMNTSGTVIYDNTQN
jgi:hypothetical protein